MAKKICLNTRHSHVGNRTFAGVYFVSRYREKSHYCVDGVEVELDDSGKWMCLANDGDYMPTFEQQEQIKLFLLHDYSEYIEWHAKLKARRGEAQSVMPFSHAHLFGARR